MCNGKHYFFNYIINKFINKKVASIIKKFN